MWHDSHSSVLIGMNCVDCKKYNFLNAGGEISFCIFAMDGIIYMVFALAMVWAWEDVLKPHNMTVPAHWGGVWV